MVDPKKRFSSTQAVLVLVGGHAQQLLRFIRTLSPEVTRTIVIDCRDELNTLGTAKAAQNSEA